MGFVIRATGGRVILIHVAKQNGYESCLLFSPEERSAKNVSKENVRGMQDDTISRQQAIEAIKREKVKVFHELYDEAWNDAINGCMEVIEQLPPIQPKRGKWIKTARWGRVYYCNQCRNYLDFDGVNAGRGSTNFCPNCGADMRGKQDDSV